MRHQKSGRKLGRTSAHRTAMFRNMTTSLLIHDRINTTDAKAKELRKYVERMITLARKVRKFGGEGEQDKAQIAKALHYRRQALAYLRLPGIDASDKEQRKGRKEIMDKLFVDLAERFADRPGGYTRIMKLGPRRGDGAPVSVIEFVEDSVEAQEKPKKGKKKKSQSTAAKKTTAKAEPKTTKAAEEVLDESEQQLEQETQTEPEVQAEQEAAPETEPEAETKPEPEQREEEKKQEE